MRDNNPRSPLLPSTTFDPRHWLARTRACHRPGCWTRCRCPASTPLSARQPTISRPLPWNGASCHTDSPHRVSSLMRNYREFLLCNQSFNTMIGYTWIHFFLLFLSLSLSPVFARSRGILMKWNNPVVPIKDFAIGRVSIRDTRNVQFFFFLLNFKIRGFEDLRGSRIRFESIQRYPRGASSGSNEIRDAPTHRRDVWLNSVTYLHGL